MIKFILPLFAVILILAACEKETDYAAVDDAAIQKYLADSNLTATKTASGLYYIVENPGTGEHPVLTSMVHVFYKGYLLDGTVFDQTNNVYRRFYLDDNSWPEGLREGLMLFGSGGKGKLFIPSEIGFGSKSGATIPSHAILIYEFKLSDIYNK